MSLALTRRFGVAILACLAAISSVRGQGTTAVPRKIGVTDAAPAPADPSPQEETESSPDDFFASLGVYIEPDVMALAEIGRRMRLSIKQMPNYTCLQSIRREKSRPGRRAERSVDWLPVSSDTVKIDVAFVDGSELYSWPGARRFDETSLPDLVGFGMVSTGNFASIGRALFLDQSGLFSHVGEVDFEGRRALRYDFRVPLFGSGYSIHHDKGEVTVEYSGSIWADAGSKDLIRIETRVEDAPPPLLVSRVISHLDYERVRIGGKDFQLPKRAYLETHFKMGGRNHNEIEFSNCRQFGAQSELSFAESGGEADLTSLSATEEFSLPSGVSVALRLATTIDSATASAGDQLRATLTQAVEQDGNLLLPKGAIVTGRLRRVERIYEPHSYFIIEFTFDRVETGTKWAHFIATMTDHGKIPDLREDFAASDGTITIPTARGPALPNAKRRETVSGPRPAGAVKLEIWGEKIRIPAGHPMVWITRER